MNNVQMGKHSLFAVHSDSIYFGSHSNVLFCSQISSNGFTVLSFRLFVHCILYYFNTLWSLVEKWYMLHENIRKYKIALEALSEGNASCILSCIMSTALLSRGWCCNVPQACAVHLSRQLAKLSWLINNHAMVLDQCTSNVLRLSAVFLLRLYSAWLRKCKGGLGSFYSLSACHRSVSACCHQSPLWHELPSYCRICLSTWPNAIGRELPVAQRPPPSQPPCCPPLPLLA